MPLTSVSMWKDGEGFKPVSADEASKAFSETVIASSDIFVCNLCNQSVTFSTGQDKKTRAHFKHSRGDKNKDCLDRIESEDRYNPKYDSERLPFPLCIDLCLDEDKYKSNLQVKIGFPPVSESLEGPLHILSDNGEIINEYRIENRLSEDDRVYLEIGDKNKLYYKYCFNLERCSPKEAFTDWPSSIDGINNKGTLFKLDSDNKLGKKLSDGAEVSIGSEYFLLVSERIACNSPNNRGIEIEEVYVRLPWYGYKLSPRELTREARDFFYEYRYRLGEKSVSLIPLWPAYMGTSCLIKHNADSMFFFVQGNAGAKLSPDIGLEDLNCKDNRQCSVLSVICRGRQKLSVGRSSVLDYKYLQRITAENEVVSMQTGLKVVDADGEPLSEGFQTVLPREKMIKIKAAYYGEASVFKNHITKDRITLKPNETVRLDSLEFGDTIEIRQGLDIVWRTEFRRKIKSCKSNDNKEAKILRLLKSCRGDTIKIHHNLGALAIRMNSCPLIKSWLYARIREGRMSYRAFKILTNYFLGVEL